VRFTATLLAVLVLAPAATADVPFAKMAFRPPPVPDCTQPKETGVKLQTRRACTAAVEWAEWMVDSGEAWDYRRPDCDRLSTKRVRCNITLHLDGVTPSGRIVNRWPFTTVSSANRGCVDLRVLGWYSTRCWL
jgi:hypothetical protein